jgi:hypothetical protein
MHCDWLNVTVPDDASHEVSCGLRKILSVVGAVAGAQMGASIVYRTVDGGTLKHSEKRGFHIFGASGGFLGSLREHKLFDSYLGLFAGLPHRVTKMDIAHDVLIDAPPVLSRLYARARGGDIHLTRKSISPSNVTYIQMPRPDGSNTGTVYLGRRTSEVHLKVYDKMWERLCAGIDGWEPTTRYELSVTGKAGASLRSAAEPAALFWNYMGDVLPVPSNAPVWTPLDDEGFQIARTGALLPAEVLSRKVANCPEIGALLALADDCGPHGFQYLLSQLTRRHNRSSLPDQPNEVLQAG